MSWTTVALGILMKILVLMAGGYFFACFCEAIRRYSATKRFTPALNAGVYLMAFVYAAVKFAAAH